MSPANDKFANGEPQLFLDCDMVLANFEEAAEKILGGPPRQVQAKIGAEKMWRILGEVEDFFFHLPLMPGARRLYEAVKHLNPIILTGASDDIRTWAEPQKRAWAAKYFPGVEVICCSSHNKRLYMKPGDVIVDDWPKYRHLWEEAGGIFILHENADKSIEQVLSLFPALV